MSTDGLAGADRRFADALAAAGRVRLPVAGVLAAWDAAMPELRGRSESHTRLASSLRTLGAAGVVDLPTRAWDRTYHPPLPRFVTVPAARRTPRATPWRTFPWRPELGWAASMPTLTTVQHDALVAVNDWLTAGADDVVVPARIRSAELFGDEKLIDALVGSSVWGEAKLTWDLLRAEHLPPPLAIRRVSEGPELLVIENIDPFWLCAQVLERAGSRIGRVAWAQGKAFHVTCPALAEEAEKPSRIWYWGDGDPEGIRIPTAAAATLTRYALPPLEPHPGLWTAYATLPVRDAGNQSWGGVASEWLGPAGWEALSEVRRVGGRVAQEAVGRRTIEDLLSQ